MVRINRSGGAICAAAVAVLLLAPGGHVNAQEFAIVWTDLGSTHNWIDEENWNPNIVGGPCNVGSLEFLVTIGCPDEMFDPVIFDITSQACLITDFFLCHHRSRLILSLDTDLTVLRTAEIDGIIDGRGGNFTAIGTASFPGNGARIFASDGSIIEIGAPTYSTAGLAFTTRILDADGEDSRINLPILTSLSTAFNDGCCAGTNGHTITATNGAQIDLSGVLETEPPARGEDWLRFTLSDDLSTINLDALEMISGVGGRTNFLMSNSAEQNLPALTTIEDVWFTLSSGAQLHVNGPPASYSSVGINWSDTIMSADGVSANGTTPTLLDLSAVMILSTAFNDGCCAGTNGHTISATDGAEIDLSALPQIDPPARPEDFVRFTLSDDLSTINLDALETISGVGGRTNFLMSDSAVQNLPTLTTMEDVWFTLSSGAQLHVNGPPASYSSVGMPWTATIMSADGVSANGTTPTLLDLSAVTILSTAFNDGCCAGTNGHTISATDGAEIDLSALLEVVPPARPEDFVRFAVSGADSTLDLSALPTITSASNGGVYFSASGAGSVLDMSALGTITGAGSRRVLVDIADGGHMQMGNVSITGVRATIDLNTDSVLSLGSLQACSPVAITLNSATDCLEVSDFLLLRDHITITAPAGGKLSIGGDFLYTHEDTDDLSLDLVRFECVGDLQQLEVGGTDVGLSWELVLPNNFGYEQLIIGQTDHASRVELVDLHDNLQPGIADALYLWGNEDREVVGLRILGGSTLVIGDLEVYALLDLNEPGVMERVRIRDLFERGVRIIPFNHNDNDGFISLEVPPHRGDVNCDGQVNAFDIEPFLLALFDPDEYVNQFPDCNINNADINADGVINAFDIEPFLALLFPCP